MNRLAELIERVERLTGPDNRIDGDIEYWVKFGPLSEWENIGGGWRRHKATGRQEKFDYGAPTPAFTASLDAAIGLTERVLPGQSVLIGWGQTEQTLPWARIGVWSEADAACPTPALALVLATLKALASQIVEEP